MQSILTFYERPKAHYTNKTIYLKVYIFYSNITSAIYYTQLLSLYQILYVYFVLVLCEVGQLDCYLNYLTNEKSTRSM